jgi:glycosyltransferase involved in cell wall biosynthesis
VARLVKEKRPTALLAYWAYPDGFATVLLSRVFRLPAFVGARGGDINELNHGSARRGMVRWALRHGSGTLAVSRALGEAIVRLGIDPATVAVIPNGVDLEFVREAGRTQDEGPVSRTGATVLYCGRLSEEKDPMGLVEAARLLFAKRADARLVLVGDGALRTKVEESAAAWNIADRITLVGEVRHEQVFQHMRRADVLCLPSLTEGYPNVLLEALACGIPVVATDVGGVREIITGPDLGIVVPPGRPEDLARALDDALSRPWDRQILRKAVSGRSWRDVARETLEFMEHAIR